MDPKAILFFWLSSSLSTRLVLFILFVALVAVWMFLLPWFETREARTGAQRRESTTVLNKVEEPLERNTRKELPEIKFGKNVDDIRSINGVRELTNSENELNVYRLPNGVYGWIEAHHISSWIPWAPSGRWVLFSSDLKDMHLRRHKKWDADVEVHKDYDGIVRILAFVNDASRIELQEPFRTQSIHLLLAFRMYRDYRFAVAIPVHRFQWFEHRRFSDGETVAEARIA